MTATAERGHVPVDGAQRVLDEIGDRGDAAASAEARRWIGEHLRAESASWDLAAARDASARDGRSVVVASEPGGVVIAARWFAPDVPTTIHGHGTWGVALVVDGDQHYEQCEVAAPGSSRVRLTVERELRAGDICTWAAPPDDIHRQQGVRGGALELLVLGGTPREVVFEADAVLDRAADALRAYDLGALRQMYTADVVLDANVPQWQYQLQGRDVVADALEAELAGAVDVRVVRSRVTRAPGARVVQLEARAGHGQDEHLWREVHILRGADAVSEHAIHCTELWDVATIERHAIGAPMVWR